MNKTEALKQNICEAINMLYVSKDHGVLNADGTVPMPFIEKFIEVCNIKFGSANGLRVAQEAFASYDKSRNKRSFFKFSKSLNGKTGLDKGTRAKVPKHTSKNEVFTVRTNTKACDFGDLIYRFVLNKKIFL